MGIESQSRNAINQNNSSLQDTVKAMAAARQAKPGTTCSSLRPLNKGQNRGKFNQLKSLLSGEMRGQTSDNVTLAQGSGRNNKNVLFDKNNFEVAQTQYGHTGFGLYKQQQQISGLYERDVVSVIGANSSLNISNLDKREPFPSNFAAGENWHPE